MAARKGKGRQAVRNGRNGFPGWGYAVIGNDQPVPPDGLGRVLNSHPRESSVLVRADRVTLLDRFVAVVDEIRGLGFHQVSLEVVRS